MSRCVRTGLLASAIALAVAGCAGAQDHTSMTGDSTGMASGMDHGSTPGAPTTTSSTVGTVPEDADHNRQDVLFAQEMILHHGQAIEMADRALTRAVDPRIKGLAGRIKAAQAPEIDQLSGWLSNWGQRAPDPAADHDMSGMGMPSMMSAEDMAELESKTDVAFDRTFLEQMIRHHEGAVVMARKEMAEGEFEPAKAMATSIVESQGAEIAEMRGILGA